VSVRLSRVPKATKSPRRTWRLGEAVNESNFGEIIALTRQNQLVPILAEIEEARKNASAFLPKRVSLVSHDEHQ
jgi:hypothetical protein